MGFVKRPQQQQQQSAEQISQENKMWDTLKHTRELAGVSDSSVSPLSKLVLVGEPNVGWTIIVGFFRSSFCKKCTP